MIPSPVRFSRMYGFVRSRQLEGTFPGDPKAGIWPITSYRVSRGWGEVPEEDWPYTGNIEHWPPAEPPDLDTKAKRYRILRYQRITNSYECKVAIASGRLVLATFEVTEQWFHAVKGIIAMPSEGAKIIGSHAVTLVGYSDEEERFKFVNSWGECWGDEGFGSLPYEFFDRWFLEAWIMEGVGQAVPSEAAAGIVEMCWGVPDFAGRIFHARELYDADSDERIGWAFAVQEQAFLDVEELYVRPQYRRRGYGTRLLQLLRTLSAEARMPLRFFIPFADCRPANLSVAERLLSKQRYILTPSGLRWSPLIAVLSVDVQTPLFALPAPPALCAPGSKLAFNGLPLSSIEPNALEEKVRTAPVSESTGLLRQPDWRSQSDETFLAAAKATFNRHASLLRRLA